MSDTKKQRRSSVITQDKTELKEPSLYKVLLHNDDYTSMEFVVAVLEKIFKKSTPEATKIMLAVHQQGIGIAGIYTREICETKVTLVHGLARKNNFPLRCTMESL